MTDLWLKERGVSFIEALLILIIFIAVFMLASVVLTQIAVQRRENTFESQRLPLPCPEDSPLRSAWQGDCL